MIYFSRIDFCHDVVLLNYYLFKMQNRPGSLAGASMEVGLKVKGVEVPLEN